MPIESTLGPDRRAHALQHSVLGESCRAVHGHFRAHVGRVWVRAWDQKGSASCLESPKSCPKAGELVESESKVPRGSCRAVHGRFRAHVGSVWVRAWDQKGSEKCPVPPKLAQSRGAS